MDKISIHLKVGNNCKIGNKVYFLNLTFNGVFYLDMNDLSVHFVHRFSFVKADAQALATIDGIFYDNVIYFFPNNTNYIMKYDILNRREGMIEIPGQEEADFCCSGAIRRENTVYIFPCNLKKGIYKFNLNEQKVEKDEELSACFEHEFWCAEILSLQDSHVIIGENGGNRVVEIDLEIKKIIEHWNLDNGVQICTLRYDGNHIWILQTESEDIYEWNREDNTLQAYKNEKAVWENRKNKNVQPYSNLVFLENETLVLNGSVENILRIDKEKKVLENPIAFPEGFQLVNRGFNGWVIYDKYTIFDGKVLLYPCRGNMLLIYDPKSGEMSGKEMVISSHEVSYLDEVIRENLSKKKLNRERDEMESIEEFIYAVTQGWKAASPSRAGDIGKVIYQSLEERKP